jgi:hypothetical protein
MSARLVGHGRGKARAYPLECLRVLWIHGSVILDPERRNATMELAIGLVLLVIGLGLVLAGRPNRQGQRLLPMSGGLKVVYPAVCLAFILSASS